MQRRIRAVVLTLALLVSVTAPATAAAAVPTPAPPREVATGLDNPRQLSFGAGDTLYVAEAGAGGDSDLCFTGPEGEVCYGETGSVTKVDVNRALVERVVTGLPSLANPSDGSGAAGPSDVLVRGNNVSVLMGLGADPQVRATDPRLARFGTILTGRLGRGPLTVSADVSALEVEFNPDGGALDSNPVGFLQFGREYVVADAGANAVFRVNGPDGSVLATFPSTNGGAQSVPTDVERGPDGSYYVSELTGFPFSPGDARIWRVTPSGQATVFATGLTNVTSLAWRGQTLYAVQIADGGLQAGPIGSLRKVTPGGSTHEAVAVGLFAPYGVAVRGTKAYVTVGAVVAGGGAVLEVALR